MPDHDKANHDKSIICYTVHSAFRPLYVSFGISQADLLSKQLLVP